MYVLAPQIFPFPFKNFILIRFKNFILIRFEDLIKMEFPARSVKLDLIRFEDLIKLGVLS